MVLCYDLSLRSEISTILFGFFLLPFVFYGNMCLRRVRFCFTHKMIRNVVNSLVEGHSMLCYCVTTASTGSHKYEVFK